MMPVGVVQVGCVVTEAVGVAGAAGRAFTVNAVVADTQPEVVFLTVTL